MPCFYIQLILRVDYAEDFCKMLIPSVFATNYMCRCTLFLGNMLGEVLFAAVFALGNNFTKLLCDTFERERVLHIKQNEKFALTFLK